jgi:hypothetical protein
VSSWKFLSGLRILACLIVFSNVITAVSLCGLVSVWWFLVLITCVQVS